jgi:hypothetical protein
MFAFAHIALVGHGICAEHGESIHAANVGLAELTGEAARTLGVVLRAPAASVGHEHEHCLCMAHGRERFLVTFSSGDRLSPPVLVCSRPAPATSTLASAIALWALAPKGSPPA